MYDSDFLLDTDVARMLYHDIAAHLPIIDFHCHLSPREIAENKRFRSITELWLGGDHYKWRAMRANGIEERYITGDADDWDKFLKWAQTVPYTMRNPLYHWTHLELQSAFGIDVPLTPDSARDIYDECNRQLESMGARDFLKKYNVECVVTTDDPVDSLQWHAQLCSQSGQSEFKTKVLPAWRPDKVMNVGGGQAYLDYLYALGTTAGIEIEDYPSLIQALYARMDFFSSHGCRIADHGLSKFPNVYVSQGKVNEIFKDLLEGALIGADEIEALQTSMLADLCRLNHKMGWAQQFHFGPMRNVNARMYRLLGPDTGFDTIGDFRAAEGVSAMLNCLDETDQLAPTILYNLNPSDNTWVAAMIANFQDGSKPGKIQMGAAWWFNDHLLGMEAQINALSMQGLLSRFVGMLTDSRSFLSYPRHDYFRRLLCRILGHDVVQGLIPRSQMDRVKGMVSDICYNNSKNYFGI